MIPHIRMNGRVRRQRTEYGCSAGSREYPGKLSTDFHGRFLRNAPEPICNQDGFTSAPCLNGIGFAISQWLGSFGVYILRQVARLLKRLRPILHTEYLALAIVAM